MSTFTRYRMLIRHFANVKSATHILVCEYFFYWTCSSANKFWKEARRHQWHGHQSRRTKIWPCSNWQSTCFGSRRLPHWTAGMGMTLMSQLSSLSSKSHYAASISERICFCSDRETLFSILLKSRTLLVWVVDPTSPFHAPLKFTTPSAKTLPQKNGDNSSKPPIKQLFFVSTSWEEDVPFFIKEEFY